MAKDNKEWDRNIYTIETNMNYLAEVATPRAVIMALNRVRTTIKSEVSKKVWAKSKHLPMVDSQGRRIFSIGTKPVKTGIKLNHIRRRVFVSRAKKTKPGIRIIGYIQPIPLASLTTRMKGGGTALKGQQVKRKSSKKRSTRGGIKIGTAMYPNHFLQFIRRNQVFHIFHRKQKKTWKDGKSGWGRAPGTTQEDRAPYDISFIDLEKPFQKHFVPTIEKVANERLKLEFDNALSVTMTRIVNSFN